MAATTGVLRCAVRARFVGRCVHGIRLPQHYPFSSSRGLWVNRVIFLPEDHCGDRSGQPLDTALLPLVLPLADRRAVHILEVLKKGPGDAVRGAVLGSGILCDYKIQELTAKAVVLEPVPATRSPAVETREVAIDLILAAPRPSRVKLLLPQIAALGVSRLVFLKAERVVRGYMQTGVLRPDKAHQLQKLLQEGLEQASVATTAPTVVVEPQFKRFFEDRAEEFIAGAPAIALHPYASEVPHMQSLAQVVAQHRGARRLVLLVGPEPGWIDYELRWIERRGFVYAQLGERVLRTDTAVVAALGTMRALVD